MYGADIRCPGSPNPHTLGMFLEGLTEANAKWWLEQRRAGFDPPCCSSCAGVVYDPDEPAQSHSFHGADELIAQPKRGWSCKEIAAFDAGVARAKAYLAGAEPGHARRTCYAKLENRGGNRFHALVVDNGQVKDPTRELERA